MVARRGSIVVSALSASGGGVTFSSDTAVAGDTLVVLEYIQGGAATPIAPTSGSGWQNRIQGDAVTTVELVAWERPVTTDGAQSITFAGIASRRIRAAAIVVAGGSFDVAAKHGGNTSLYALGGYKLVTPAVTTTEDDDLLIRAAMPVTTGTITGSSTEEFDVNGPDAFAYTHSGGDEGPQPTVTALYSVDTDYLSITVAYKPVTTSVQTLATAHRTASAKPVAVVTGTILQTAHRVSTPKQVQRVSVTELTTAHRTGTAYAPTSPGPGVVPLKTAHRLTILPNIIPMRGQPTPAEVARARLVRNPETGDDGLRIMAQSLVSGEWLDLDVQLSEVELAWVRNNPAELRARIATAQPRYLKDSGRPIFEPYGTLLHVESDGVLQASLMVLPHGREADGLILNAVGFSYWLRRQFYLGDYKGVQVNPYDIVEEAWRHGQEMAGGWLGVEVEQVGSRPPYQVGTEERDVNLETGEGEQVSFTAGPFKMNKQNVTNCGEVIDKLAVDYAFDWDEHSEWEDPDPDSGNANILYSIKLYWPRQGTANPGVFAMNQNIQEMSEPEEIDSEDDGWCSEMIGVGKGDGTAMVFAHEIDPNEDRTRIMGELTDKQETSKERLTRRVKARLKSRQRSTDKIAQIVVGARHSNAPFGSYHKGDDIEVTGELPNYGEFAIPHRIEAVKLIRNTDQVLLELENAGSYEYGVDAIDAEAS